MAKLTNIQQNILARLIYIESFEDVLDETKLQPGELRDELIQLINKGYIEVHNRGNSGHSIIRFYDTDNMHLFNFRATKAGLKHI